MHEALKNIGFIHGHCGAERKRMWQEDNKDTVIEPGDFVKIGFKVTNPELKAEYENMWVKVTHVSDDRQKFRGTLNNESIGTSLKWGEPLEFERTEIQDLIK